MVIDKISIIKIKEVSKIFLLFWKRYKITLIIDDININPEEIITIQMSGKSMDMIKELSKSRFLP